MSADQNEPNQAAGRLLACLRQFSKDRGAMADLRCALNPTKLPRAWPLLARVGGIGNPRIETVAGLFAYHPAETHAGNFGTTCLALKAEARFRRLLACDRDEICERLRPVILAARAKGIPVNYEQLFADLCYWSPSVKARWAQEYWSATGSEEPDVVSAPEVTP